MFRGVLNVIAGLLASATASAAGSAELALAERIARAQVTIAKLENLAKGKNKNQAQEPRVESKERQWQNWHNHHWTNQHIFR